MKVLQRLALAASSVTCLPLAGDTVKPEQLHGLAKYLPAVGLLIGVLLVPLTYVLATVSKQNSLLLGILLCLSWLILTGSIHLDGLMDTADGIFSHRSPERMLEIMRDSRVGNFGVLCGVAIILLKSACLAGLAFTTLLTILMLVPMWARWCETFAIAVFPYARPQGMGKIWHDSTRSPQDIIAATIIPLAASCACLYLADWKTVLIIVLACLGSGLAAAYYIASFIKGHTGDTYGAVVELAETGALLVSALVFH